MPAQTGRNAEIIRLAKAGEGPASIARQLGMKRETVRQIIDLAKRRERFRTDLIQRYGECPNIASLPDDTAIEVLALCPGMIQAWETRVRNLAFVPPTPVKTLGHLRTTSDTHLRKNSLIGRGFLRELRRFCPGPQASGPLKIQPDTRVEVRAALRMIRAVVEQHAPPGSLPNEEIVDVTHEAEAIVRGILEIVRSKGTC